MKIFYFFVTSLKDYKLADWNLYKTYFDPSGFIVSFAIAVGIACIMALIFYACLGRKFSTSKISIWFVMLFVSAALSFGTTSYTVSSGIAHKIETIKKDKIKKHVPADEVNKTVKKLKKETKFSNSTPIQRVAFGNFFYTLLFFYLFSLIFKHEPITKYATEIPHKKP